MEPAAGDSSDPPAPATPEDPSPAETSSSPPSAAAVAREVAAAMETVERDAAAIASSYASLFASLRVALSNVTSTSAENIECLGDVVGRLQESALEASSKGNKYINSCLRLNEEMRGLESLALHRCTQFPCPSGVIVMIIGSESISMKFCSKDSLFTISYPYTRLTSFEFLVPGSLLKKFTGAAGTLWRNRGCLIKKNPRQSAITWNGVTYNITAVIKQNIRNIAVALGSLQLSSDCSLSP